MHRQLGEHRAQREGQPTDRFVQRHLVFQMHHGNRDDSKLLPLTATAGEIEGKWDASNSHCVCVCVSVLLVVNNNAKCDPVAYL